MDENKDLISMLVHELALMSIGELEVFWSDWKKVLEEREMPQLIMYICHQAVYLVIQKKREKAGILR